ncbi:hypothetical protein D9M72_467750 [compost metagenome]
MPEPIFRNIRLLMPLWGPHVTSDSAPRLASLSTKTGKFRVSSRCCRMLMPTHSGRIAPCATVPVRRSIGPGIPTPAPTTALRSTPLSSSSLARSSTAARMPSSAWWPSGSSTDSSAMMW